MYFSKPGILIASKMAILPPLLSLINTGNDRFSRNYHYSGLQGPDRFSAIYVVTCNIQSTTTITDFFVVGKISGILVYSGRSNLKLERHQKRLGDYLLWYVVYKRRVDGLFNKSN